MSLNIITKNIIKTCMTKVGLIQTRSYENNKKGIENVSKLLEKLGRIETEIVCLPEQWLPNNQIENYDQKILSLKKLQKIIQ
jgi:omega-amidase